MLGNGSLKIVQHDPTISDALDTEMVKSGIHIHRNTGGIESISLANGKKDVTTVTGDTIYGRPWLAIPLTGTPDVPGPRQDPAHLFTLRARDGRLFLASRDSGVLQLHWKLQHSVEPVHHPFFRPGVEQAREGFEARLLDALTAEVM